MSLSCGQIKTTIKMTMNATEDHAKYFYSPILQVFKIRSYQNFNKYIKKQFHDTNISIFNIDNIVIVKRLLKENKSFKITVTGIQLSYLSSSSVSLQKCYSYVLVLISDFIMDEYKIERELREKKPPFSFNK